MTIIMEETAAVKDKNEKLAIIKEIFEWAETIILALTTVIIVLTFTARLTVVDGASMMPTLVNGEYLMISNLFYEPAYNDIIVLQAKNLPNEMGELGKPIVKRVIGLEGDKIKIDFEEGIVYRNGEALMFEEKDSLSFEDGHTVEDRTYFQSDMMSNEEVTVPENSLFVLGDNRNNSLDSRYNTIGMVDKHYLVGKVYFRFFPVNKFGSVS